MMDIKTLACFIVLCSFLCKHGSQGHIQLSQSTKLELEKQYQLLQKPSLKTIQSSHGDIYDCVDFYKQLAFDHPCLKNHTFHPKMRPSIIPEREKTISSPENKVSQYIELKGIGCPKGTVPIRRMSKDQFLKTIEFTKHYSARKKARSIQPQSGTNYAVIQSKFDPSKIYNGIGGEPSIYNLPIGSSQYTSGETIAQNGDDRIQVGWTVNPALNHDNQTRLFQYFNAGKSHCFNILCPGFVSVNPDIPVDIAITPTSIIGKDVRYIVTYIFQDPKDGNWWFATSKDKKLIGFWPQKIFTGLAKSASYVAVGGETYSPPGEPLPPMGSGHYPKPDWNMRVIGHWANIFVVDKDHHIADLQDTEEFTTNNIYGVVDKGRTFWLGHSIFYGGRP